jgi:hypothetical protein
MNRAAVDSPLENKHRGALRIIGVFLDDDRRTSPQEELVDREPIVGQTVISVLGYPNITGCDQSGDLLPETGHRAFSGRFSYSA